MNAMRVINRKGRAMVVVAAMMITMIPVPARAQIFGGKTIEIWSQRRDSNP